MNRAPLSPRLISREACVSTLIVAGLAAGITLVALLLALCGMTAPLAGIYAVVVCCGGVIGAATVLGYRSERARSKDEPVSPKAAVDAGLSDS